MNIMTPAERGRAWYESGDSDDPPWESLSPAEQQAWIDEAMGDELDDTSWAQWQPDVVQ